MITLHDPAGYEGLGRDFHLENYTIHIYGHRWEATGTLHPDDAAALEVGARYQAILGTPEPTSTTAVVTNITGNFTETTQHGDRWPTRHIVNCTVGLYGDPLEDDR